MDNYKWKKKVFKRVLQEKKNLKVVNLSCNN